MDNSSAARRADGAPAFGIFEAEIFPRHLIKTADSSFGPRGRRDLRGKDEKTRMRINDALRRVAKLKHRPGAR